MMLIDANLTFSCAQHVKYSFDQFFKNSFYEGIGLMKVEHLKDHKNIFFNSIQNIHSFLFVVAWGRPNKFNCITLFKSIQTA